MPWPALELKSSSLRFWLKCLFNLAPECFINVEGNSNAGINQINGFYGNGTRCLIQLQENTCAGITYICGFYNDDTYWFGFLETLWSLFMQIDWIGNWTSVLCFMRWCNVSLHKLTKKTLEYEKYMTGIYLGTFQQIDFLRSILVINMVI